MSRLSDIYRGRRATPPRILLYGPEGVGKSQCGGSAPGAIALVTEDGMNHVDCDKFPLATALKDVESALEALCSDSHSYRTVVIDTLDWLERMIWDRLCQEYGVNSIERVDGGYGRGYTHALTSWRRILDRLTQLRDQRGMVVLLLAHAKVEKYEDPEAPTYDRYSPRLHKHASALVCEWCDAVLFATRKIITRTEDGAFNRSRTIATGLGRDGGERILRTIGGPSCVAKNRYNLPAELPLDWSVLMAAIAADMQPTTSSVLITGEPQDGQSAEL